MLRSKEENFYFKNILNGAEISDLNLATDLRLNPSYNC
jgi:hypothetical protein